MILGSKYLNLRVYDVLRVYSSAVNQFNLIIFWHIVFFCLGCSSFVEIDQNFTISEEYTAEERLYGDQLKTVYSTVTILMPPTQN